MSIQEAIDYLDFLVKEGYLDENFAQTLLKLPVKKMLKEVERMADEGDDYANKYQN